MFAARLTDVAGNVGGIGGNLTVSLDTTAPAAYKIRSSSMQPLEISPTEKAANIIVQASLAGTSAVAGDSIGTWLSTESRSAKFDRPPSYQC